MASRLRTLELAIEKPEAIKEELEGSKRVLEADLIRLACAGAACLGLLWFAEDREDRIVS